MLVPDAGVEGVVLRVMARDIAFHEEGEAELLIADAGALWEEVVEAAGVKGLFGIENLAGIPGTLGGAAVQNIGAYGAEFSQVFVYADGIDQPTGETRRIEGAQSLFAYRSSFFKSNPQFIVMRVALRLLKQAPLNTAYADLARLQASGIPLTTPSEVARAVRAVRAEKFPHTAGEGTAGSFFKNPIISQEHAAQLSERFPGLPAFPQADGRVKISLAWILDHVLALKGYAKGRVRLYEKQPLVMVGSTGATEAEVNALAREVRERVYAAVNITIEREVETFGTPATFLPDTQG